jgi:hypothetical protein
MAKGKHAPAKGAVKKDKVIHPKSRKAVKLEGKERRKHKLSIAYKAGGAKLQATGEKLAWFKENLPLCEEDDDETVKKVVSKDVMLSLTEAFLNR